MPFKIGLKATSEIQ